MIVVTRCSSRAGQLLPAAFGDRSPCKASTSTPSRLYTHDPYIHTRRSNYHLSSRRRHSLACRPLVHSPPHISPHSTQHTRAHNTQQQHTNLLFPVHHKPRPRSYRTLHIPLFVSIYLFVMVMPCYPWMIRHCTQRLLLCVSSL